MEALMWLDHDASIARARLAALMAALVSISACTGDARPARAGDTTKPVAAALPDTAPDPARLARARGAADALGKELQGALLAALERGGPMAAVSFCADSAQAISARQAAAGITARRVSLRVRNPQNRPDAAERGWLVQLDSLQRAGRLPAEVAREVNGRLEYMRPIVVADRCLTCHGDPATIPAGVRKLLRARYPADSATGYRAGDLRGGISVRVGG